ncbi:MAG: hypothetical protein ABL973_18070 [Micropepsaceae bacterium]
MAIMSTGIFDRADALRALGNAQFHDVNFFRKLRDEPAGFALAAERRCLRVVKKLIYLIQPKAIVTSGADALRSLLRMSEPPEELPKRFPILHKIESEEIEHFFRYKGFRSPVYPLAHLSGRGTSADILKATIKKLRKLFG